MSHRDNLDHIFRKIENLEHDVKHERAQRELLEARLRVCEDEWFVHDVILCGIREQLWGIRQLPADLNEALSSIVEGFRSVQRRLERHQEPLEEEEEHF